MATLNIVDILDFNSDLQNKSIEHFNFLNILSNHLPKTLLLLFLSIW